MSRPQRITGFDYIGPYRYFLTFCTRSRQSAFLDDATVEQTLVQIRRTARDEGFAIIAYCLMPDHMHLLVEGTTDGANLRRFVKSSKQRSGAAFALRRGGPLWQEGYYDRVLRADADLKAIARYIIENPVRAQLVPHASEYRFSGSELWSMTELLDSIV
jgi:putative transposase